MSSTICHLFFAALLLLPLLSFLILFCFIIFLLVSSHFGFSHRQRSLGAAVVSERKIIQESKDKMQGVPFEHHEALDCKDD